MNRIFAAQAAALFVFVALVVQCALAELPVFPGAVGFGTTTTAGSGRHLSPARTTIIPVTTLADSGDGSLRACIAKRTPRVCVFELSGVIRIESPLRITSPYLTVAGQTSPPPGIGISGAGIDITAHDVLLQHIQVRPGDVKNNANPDSRDAISVRGDGFNIVIDHVSASWSIDENFSTGQQGTHDITLSNSIIAEALYDSIHRKGPHSMGALIGDGSKKISIHDCLFAHNNDRNPRFKPGVTAEFVNNVVYGWGGWTAWNTANFSDTQNTGTPVLLNFEGNYFIPGPASPRSAVLYAKPAASGSRIYVLNNFGPTRKSEDESEWAITGLAEMPFRSMEPAFPGSGISVRRPPDTLGFVLAHAGSRPGERNSADKRVLQDVKDGIGTVKDCVQGCVRSTAGWKGMELQRQPFKIPENPDRDDDQDGYTNLEETLHALSANVEQR